MLLDRGDKAPAGAGFNYSNLGYSLLGLVVAAVSGRSYGDFVTESIVEPLGLRHTGPEWDESRADEYAAGHSGRHVSQTRVRLAHVDTRAMAAATGWPANVNPWANISVPCMKGSATRSEAIIAPIGA